MQCPAPRRAILRPIRLVAVGVEEHRHTPCHEAVLAQLLAGAHGELRDRPHQLLKVGDRRAERARHRHALTIGSHEFDRVGLDAVEFGHEALQYDGAKPPRLPQRHVAQLASGSNAEVAQLARGRAPYPPHVRGVEPVHHVAADIFVAQVCDPVEDRILLGGRVAELGQRLGWP